MIGLRMDRSAAFALALAALSGLPGAMQAGAVSVRDGTGRTVEIRDTGRIVSIGGAVTEIFYALGLDDRIVAVDTTSLFPPSALRSKPNVGYMRQLSPEGVLGLSPTLIVAAEGAGPKEAIAVLDNAAVPFVHVPDRFTGEGIVEKIALIAGAAGKEARGQCLASIVEADLAALARLRSGIVRPARVMFVLSFANGRPMVAGRGTAADGIIRMTGAVNALDDIQGYKTVSDEAIAAARPDAILSMQREGFRLDAAEVFAQPAIALTPAAQGKNLIVMDGLYLLGFGPRTARAARDLAQRLYPEMPHAQLPSDLRDPAKDCIR
ncbi:MAG: hemin ABC transporter substrate-binding protein [Pseudorhodoplanes sp.]